MAALAAPCGLTCLASCAASCAVNALCSACCSIAGCFLPRSAKLAKLFYLLLFTFSACFAIVLRYYGSEILGGWVATIKTCAVDGAGASACFGLQASCIAMAPSAHRLLLTRRPTCAVDDANPLVLQAVYRLSASLCGFFFLLAGLTFCVPILHHGAWLLKLLFFIVLCGISLAIPNTFFVGYAETSRYLSIGFLVLQCLLMVDLAYSIHDWLLDRIAAKEKKFVEDNFEPGVCSNLWKLLYVVLSLALLAGSVVGIGFMYKYFGQCPLSQFFLSETLIVGLVLLVFSVWGAESKGMLPPCMLWAYATYLCFGSLSNNPDANCNLLASSARESQASIITGLAFAILSITYAAYSTAGGVLKAVTGATPAPAPAPGTAALPSSPAAGTGAGGAAAAATVPATAAADVEAGVPAATAPAAAAGSSGAPKADAAATGAAAAYAEEAPAAASSSGSSGSSSGAGVPAWDKREGAASSGGCCGGSGASGEADAAPPRHIWLFHVVLSLAGLYLAMLATSWGDPSTVSRQTGNPELSEASMWVRIVSQWVIWLLFAWTLVAPRCCPNRSFA